MHQALLPSGYTPQIVYDQYLTYLRNLEEHRDSTYSEFTFARTVHPPGELEPGTLFLSVHTSIYFANLPFALRRIIPDGRRLNVVIRRSSRTSLPAWKQHAYQQMEDQFNVRFLYTDDDSFMIKLIKALKAGEYGLSFVDSLPEGRHVSTQALPFLNCTVDLPSGFFMLAQKFGLPLLPIVAIDIDQPTLSMSHPIRVAKNQALTTAMADCYGFFQNAIFARPSDWAQWGFLYDQYHNPAYVEFSGLNPAEDIQFNVGEHGYRFNGERGHIQAL